MRLMRPPGERPMISIYAPCVGSDIDAVSFCLLCDISIHAPRAGSDAHVNQSPCFHTISIHAPRAGSDPLVYGVTISGAVFQSTLPVRGATTGGRGARHAQRISIHAPRAGSDGGGGVLRRRVCISIHAPRAGSDATTV